MNEASVETNYKAHTSYVENYSQWIVPTCNFFPFRLLKFLLEFLGANPERDKMVSDAITKLKQARSAININDDFGEHFWGIAVSSVTQVGILEDLAVQTINRLVNDANEEIGKNVVLQVHWQIVSQNEERPSLSHL